VRALVHLRKTPLTIGCRPIVPFWLGGSDGRTARGQKQEHSYRPKTPERSTRSGCVGGDGKEQTTASKVKPPSNAKWVVGRSQVPFAFSPQEAIG
jgi:hypothetical protein